MYWGASSPGEKEICLHVSYGTIQKRQKANHVEPKLKVKVKVWGCF